MYERLPLPILSVWKAFTADLICMKGFHCRSYPYERLPRPILSVWKASTADLICMKGFHCRSYPYERLSLPILSVWKAFTSDLICMKGFHGRSYGIEGKCKNAGNFKCVERNATLRCVIFLEAVLVGFNYLNYILNIFFPEITLIIIQTNTLTQLLYFGTKCKLFGKWQITKI